jgi:LuxR family quorum sensing-dependent transcriptional regulator
VGESPSSVFDFVVAVEKMTGADEVWNLLMSFSARYGLQHGALVNLPGPGEGLKDAAVYLSCPPEWRQRYFEKNYFLDDPAALHIERSADPYTWSDLLDHPDYTTAQRRIIYEASEFGMHAGLVVPLFGHARTAIIELAGPNPDLGTREKAKLRLASLSAHSRLQAILKPRRNGLPRLSHREREVLQWAAVGKSDWEIGEILSISEKTVNSHIENIKRKYGVTSRIHAVVKGMGSRAIQN